MEASNKSFKLLTLTKGKYVQYIEHNDLAFKLLVKLKMQSQPLGINVLLMYCLAPAVYGLGTTD